MNEYDRRLLNELIMVLESQRQNCSGTSRPPLKWTESEDRLLTDLALQAEGAPQWKKIASQLAQKLHIPERASSDVRYRWMRVIHPKFRKGKWLQQEDDILLSLVYTHHHNWAQLSNAMKTRSDIQIKYRVEKLGI